MTEAETALWSRVYADAVQSITSAIVCGKVEIMDIDVMRRTCAKDADDAVAMLRERMK